MPIFEPAPHGRSNLSVTLRPGGGNSFYVIGPLNTYGKAQTEVNLASQPLSFEDILSTTSRVPLSRTDVGCIVDHLGKCRRNGLDLSINGVSSEEGMMKLVQAGILPLQSQALATDFLFVNVDAGRGIFGGQKARIATYTSDISRQEFFPGPVLGGIIRALVGINNMYRGAGILKGGAF